MSGSGKNKPLRRYSIIKRLSISLLCVYVGLFGLMLVNDIYALRVAREEICRGLYQSLQMFNRQFSDELSSVEVYLAGRTNQASVVDLKRIEKSEETPAFYSAIEREKREMQNALYTFGMAKGLFLFPTTNQLFISTAKEAGDVMVSTLRQFTRDSCASGELENLPSRKWFPIYAEGQYYLIRYFRIGQSYVGAWTDFSAILSQVESHQELAEQVLFTFDGEMSFSSLSQESNLLPAAAASVTNYSVLEADRKYLTIAVSAKHVPNGYIVMLVPDEKLSSRLFQNYFLMAVIGGVFLLLFLLSLFILRRYLRQPIGDLKCSIDALRTGDFSTRVAADYGCEEFSQVNTAFNEMVEKIHELRIHVYEEQLRQQGMEMKFLKAQLAPHFLINCLNAIYHMAGANETKYIRKMAVSLGSHLRYALAERPRVSLAQELDMARNYIELSNLRFPGCIEAYFSVEEGTQCAKVLSMSILTFVENTVKYTVVMGDVIEVHVETAFEERAGKKILLLRVWDTGSGWPPQTLKYLNSGQLRASEDGRRIGLYNIMRRGALTYDEAYSVRFTNRPGAGAQVEMCFPFELYRESTEIEGEQET